MKTLSALLLLLASVGIGDAADLCAPQPKSCVNLPQSSAKACSSLISKSKLRLTTCSIPKSTVIKTSTIQPITTKTVTVTQTISSNIVTNLQRTVLNTVTSTTISQTTLVETATSTAQTTIVVPETSTITQSITETTTSTTSIPYQRATCAATTVVVRKRQSNYKALDIIPRDCSCYLTSTTTCGQPTTTWSTITKPTSTAYVTQYKLTTVVRFDTRTSNIPQTTTTVTAAFSTKTSTTIIDTTETQSVTSVVATATSTTTTTATATATSMADPCADPTLYVAIRPSYPGSILGTGSDSDSPKDCCQRCFSSNRGCLFWRYYNNYCAQYMIPYQSSAVSCITNSCPKGRPSLVPAPADGTMYGVGICAAEGFVGL